MARAGERERPSVPPPARLLPYLEFTRYPPAALDVARRVLDEDEAFRARVAASIDMAQVGEAGELFLVRPSGWDAALAEIEAAATSKAESQADDRQQRRATKQLQITKEALGEARRQAYAEAAAAGRLRAELQAEREAALELR